MLTRPPPLQLQLDNNFPVQQQPVPHSPSAVKSFFSQIYKANWRNVVIAVTGINALRFFISASNAFQDVGIDTIHHASKLARISTALGALYISIAVIQIFGIFSVSTQQLKLIRAYVHLAFVSGLLITVAGFIAVVAYFLLAEDLVRECVALSVDGSLQTKAIFRGKMWKSTLPSPRDAQNHCLNAWSQGSVSQVFSAFTFSLIPAIAFFLLAYAYYRQTTDPNHPASLCISHRGGSVLRIDAYPGAHYASLRNGTAPPLYSDDITDALYKPRQQRHTHTSKSKHAPTNPKVNLKPKTRQATVHTQLSPIMRTAYSPYMLTPGPPSFGPSRDYRPVFFTVYFSILKPFPDPFMEI